MIEKELKETFEKAGGGGGFAAAAIMVAPLITMKVLHAEMCRHTVAKPVGSFFLDKDNTDGIQP